MRTVKSVLVGLGVAVLSATLLAQAGVRRDGNWDIAVEMSMPGMPTSMPPMHVTQCITPEEVADPSKAAIGGPMGRGRGRGAPENDCKVSDYKAVGSKVTYTMTCTTPQPMTMNADLTYTADTFEGTMTMNGQRGGQPMTMTMKYTGKRLGDCVK